MWHTIIKNSDGSSACNWVFGYPKLCRKVVVWKVEQSISSFLPDIWWFFKYFYPIWSTPLLKNIFNFSKYEGKIDKKTCTTCLISISSPNTSKIRNSCFCYRILHFKNDIHFKNFIIAKDEKCTDKQSAPDIFGI